MNFSAKVYLRCCRFFASFCFTVLLVSAFSCKNANKKNVRIQSSDYTFPKTEAGNIAKIWFQAINENKPRLLESYIEDDLTYELLGLLQAHSKKVGGIIPKMNSCYQEDYISIYAKEKNGIWVKVNISLEDGVIDHMSLKKTYKPIENKFIKNMSDDERNEIVNDLIESIKSNYVIPEQAEKISSQLRERLNSGNYGNINQGDFLAVKLTKDLRAISNDRHLEIIPPTMRNAYLNRFTETSSEDPHTNFAYIIKSEVVDNNIGLITLKSFSGKAEVLKKTDSIFNSLSNSRAIIIDLRNSGGGDESHVIQLLSYFFTNKTLVSTSENRVTGERRAAYTQPNELSKVFSEKPVYVLTSKKTISAGEALTYFLQYKNRANVVGEVTAGAGYKVDAFKLKHGFYFVCSITTSYDPDGNIGWEGSGVEPDIRVNKNEALQTALDKINSIK